MTSGFKTDVRLRGGWTCRHQPGGSFTPSYTIIRLPLGAIIVAHGHHAISAGNGRWLHSSAASIMPHTTTNKTIGILYVQLLY